MLAEDSVKVPGFAGSEVRLGWRFPVGNAVSGEGAWQNNSDHRFSRAAKLCFGVVSVLSRPMPEPVALNAFNT